VSRLLAVGAHEQAAALAVSGYTKITDARRREAYGQMQESGL
jgi:hypothetical protein